MYNLRREKVERSILLQQWNEKKRLTTTHWINALTGVKIKVYIDDYLAKVFPRCSFFVEELSSCRKSLRDLTRSCTCNDNKYTHTQRNDFLAAFQIDEIILTQLKFSKLWFPITYTETRKQLVKNTLLFCIVVVYFGTKELNMSGVLSELIEWYVCIRAKSLGNPTRSLVSHSDSLKHYIA